MNSQILEPCLVLALLMNFYVLGVSRLNALIKGVAAQGVLLGLMYPVAHQGFLPVVGGPESSLNVVGWLRLLLLTLVIIGIKGWVIPRLLLRAATQAESKTTVSSIIGFIPSLLLGAVGTGAVMQFARSLPLTENHHTQFLIPAALATVFVGFLLLVTRREAIGQVLGYVVLENGIFIFGLLLIEVVPLMVELGVVLDLFVGVFVMGITVNHVSRAFPEASSEHLTSLRE